MDKANLTFKAKLASLQQHLPFTVCAEGCETAEEQRDDEVRTSQVPEQSEGKTKVIRQQYLPFTVLKRCFFVCIEVIRNNNTLQQHLPSTVLKPIRTNECVSTFYVVAIAPTVYGIETFFWKHREHINRKLVATAYGMRRRVRDSREAERR